MGSVARFRPNLLWIVPLVLLPGLVSSSAYTPAPRASGAGDTTADRVLGQGDFSGSAANAAGVSAASLSNANGLTVDRNTGQLYVADSANNRVLRWPSAAAFRNGQPAELVIGQPDFSQGEVNQGGPASASSLYYPNGAALDGAGNLYVADTANHRVLIYGAPLSSGMAASRVIGQPDFTSTQKDRGGTPGATTLDLPWGVLVDGSGRLYVAETGNNRVLIFDSPLSAPVNLAADRVIGQADFSGGQGNRGRTPAANTLNGAYSVALTSAGHLFVADSYNHRVLEYDTPLAQTSDLSATRVYGQPNFTSREINRGQAAPGPDTLHEPCGVAVDGSDNLYILDRSNSRVLEFDTPLADASADRVFGQPGFATNVVNYGGTSAASLHYPEGVAVDAAGNVYIADWGNSRVLGFDQPRLKQVPTLSTLEPARVTAGASAFTLTITGGNFRPGASVLWNGASRPTAVLSPTTLTVAVSGADIAQPGFVRLTVVNPEPSGAASIAALFPVQERLSLPLVLS